MGFCRDCLAEAAPQTRRCAACGSPRLLRHDEIDTLAIAHVDCDAFYATIEKRDDPSLAADPVIVGGGKRGVVATCCYIARTYGVKSAMPMFEALRLCPHAKVVRPNFEKYSKVGRQVRQLMFALTPLVEPLSIDEAFLDLSGTSGLHGLSPAKVLARFATDVEKNLKITVSIGLSCNKFLAKVASDLDKPRGFAVLGGAEAPAFLAPKPVGFIYGVGKVSAARYARDGFSHIADLQRTSEIELMRRYGEEGRRLARLARGIDTRQVTAERETKSVSSETYVRARHRRFPLAGEDLVEPSGGRVGAAQKQGIGRRHRDAETQDREFQDPHPGAVTGRADATGRAYFCRFPRPPRA